MKEPTLKELECIISWPKGTNGYEDEKRVLSTLLNLCRLHGFGRVPQMAAGVEKVWRKEEEAIEALMKVKREHFKALRESWESCGQKSPCPYTEENM